MTNECLVRYSKPILCNRSSRLSDKLAVESNPDQGVNFTTKIERKINETMGRKITKELENKRQEER
jgi:hypothetical protein